MVAARHFRSPWHTGGNASAAAALPRRTPRGGRPIIAGGSNMRAHQPGSTPIDIPETVPNPAYSRARTRAGAGADQSAGKGARKSNRPGVIRGVFLSAVNTAEPRPFFLQVGALPGWV